MIGDILTITFDSLDLIEPLRRAVADQGYVNPTPIQEKAIPPLLDGKDVLGVAQTGTGKTAAFLLPILQHMAKNPRQGKRVIRGLVLTPTRELAAQIADNFEEYGSYLDFRHHVIFGGVNQRPQVNALRRGIDILVATPGRLLDLQNQGYIDFRDIEFFVLDEADRMLDMGFIHDIRKVLALLPNKRQNLLFSATMPESIVKLASGFLDRPVRVEVTPQATTVELIDQKVMFTAKADKRRLLASILSGPEVDCAIVFTRTKHGANRVVKELAKSDIEAAAIHGNKSQAARTRALNGFRNGDIRVLVATDIAARGIDVDLVTHVFNYDIPNIPETYVHRIGRTGRAGRGGIAIAFCDETEAGFLRSIERLTGQEIPRDLDHPWHLPDAMPRAGVKYPKNPANNGGSRQGRGGRSDDRNRSSDNRRSGRGRRGRGPRSQN
jgi:ATP-dependent RNA helicase RhlE